MPHSLVAITYEVSPTIGQYEARYIERQPIDLPPPPSNTGAMSSA